MSSQRRDAKTQSDRICISNYILPTCRNLVRFANADPDQVSFLTLGKTVEEPEGAIIVVKGNQPTRFLRDLLIRQKLMRADMKWLPRQKRSEPQ